MALDDMLRALEEEGRSQQAEIISTAKKQAADIVKGAKAQVAEIEATHTDRVNRSVEDETAKMLTEARRKVERGISKVKETMIEDAFAGAASGLKTARKAGDYETVFAALAHDAIQKAEGHVVVHIDSRDQKLAETILKKAGFDYELRADLVTDGGLIISAEEGRVIIDNTFESRAARARVFMKSQVASRLFKEDN
jgi:vacuolar-type H+-ATPase subunit E/Vma4